MNIPRVLIIAGSDSSGGCGLQADLKRMFPGCLWHDRNHRAYSAEHNRRVAHIEVLPEFVALQIKACAIDIGCDSVKTGMLANTSIIETVTASVSSIASSRWLSIR